MYMRGVFFALFWVLILSTSVQGVNLNGEFSGKVSTEGVMHAMTLESQKDLARGELELGLDSQWSPGHFLRTHTKWQLKTIVWPLLQFTLSHNVDHYTSSDIFRIINKNNYTEESHFLGLETKQLKLGYLRKVPLRNRDVVDAVFAESVLELGPISLTALGHRFAGTTESGSGQVIQGESRLGSLDAIAAVGWQSNSKGEEHQGLVFELNKNGPGWNGNFVLQRVDPGFLSVLAKTNRYTPNRRGWQLQISVPQSGLDLGFNMRQLTNADRTREYHQLSFELSVKDKNVGLKWRIQPTSAFVIQHTGRDTLFQLDPLNLTLRTDLKLGETSWSFRFDGARLIARLECKFTGSLEWRLIGKHDFLEWRSHYSLLVRGNAKNGHFQIDLGEYDRGNMASSFGKSTSFGISWGWKF